MSRHVLLVTYYFPPAGGPGVQRALNFAKYLPQNGWKCTVLTVRSDAASFPDRDETLAEDIPPSVRVERTAAWDPYSLYAALRRKERKEVVTVSVAADEAVSWKERLAQWVRANVFLPDARVGWVPFALQRALRLYDQSAVSAVVTTGPPHSTHLIGLGLRHLRGIPWIADFRDPWTGIDYYDALPMTNLARWVDEALERRVLRNASRVVTVTPTWCGQLRQRYLRHYDLIRNGFAPDDFEGVEHRRPDHFVIGYIGNMNEARNPVTLWRALAQLDAPRRMPRLRICITGSIHPRVGEEARRHGVGQLVELYDYVPHGVAVQRMVQSSLLLLMINRMSAPRGIIPGKLYEYLASGRPVLAIGPPEGDAADVLNEVEGGQAFRYEDADAVAAYIEDHYRAWEAGRERKGADADTISRFSRRTQTEQLADLLSSIEGGD